MAIQYQTTRATSPIVIPVAGAARSILRKATTRKKFLPMETAGMDRAGK